MTTETTGSESGGRATEIPWDAFKVRLWLPVTEVRPHAVAVGSYSEAFELARAKNGGHVTDFDVVAVEFVYPGRKAE